MRGPGFREVGGCQVQIQRCRWEGTAPNPSLVSGKLLSDWRLLSRWICLISANAKEFLAVKWDFKQPFQFAIRRIKFAPDGHLTWKHPWMDLCEVLFSFWEKSVGKNLLVWTILQVYAGNRVMERSTGVSWAKWLFLGVLQNSSCQECSLALACWLYGDIFLLHWCVHTVVTAKRFFFWGWKLVLQPSRQRKKRKWKKYSLQIGNSC